MKYKFSVSLVINGHGFFAFLHRAVESIGMATGIELAQNIFEDYFAKLPDSEQIVLRLAFENKKELFSSSTMFVFLLEDGTPQKDGLIHYFLKSQIDFMKR